MKRQDFEFDDPFTFVPELIPVEKRCPKNNERGNSSRKMLAIMLAFSVLLSGVLGFAGGMLASRINSANQSQIVTGVSASPVSTDAAQTVFSAAKVAAACMNSVVEINTESVKRGSRMGQYIADGAGSGVIITSDGYIATNNHVIDGAGKISVTLRNGKDYEATLIGKDSKTDLAVIKINATGLTPATFGSSSGLVVGEPVVAIGNPLGELGGTVTDGIISALDRQIDIDNQKMTLLQTNASINPGNSGGGLFNAQGLLIGIVNAKSSGSGIEGLGFAIPVDSAKSILEQLKTNGYVTGRIDIGMEFADVSNMNAFFYGLRSGGVYISNVTAGSNAERAGFKTGDRVVSIAGKTVESADSISSMLEGYSVSDTVSIVISRNGENRTLKLTLAQAKPANGSVY